jgi:hypothetical protein
MQNTGLQINCQFRTGDLVWYINSEMKAVQFPITTIRAEQDKRGKITIELYVNIGTDENYQCEIVKAEHAFSTREFLISSL